MGRSVVFDKDHLSGRVVFVGKARKEKTLKRFFNQLIAKQRRAIEAVQGGSGA